MTLWNATEDENGGNYPFDFTQDKPPKPPGLRRYFQGS